MTKTLALLLAVLTIALLATGCNFEEEGLLEHSFNRAKSESKTILLDISEVYDWVEFKLDSDLDRGSTSAYIFDPLGNRHTLALGSTHKTDSLTFTSPPQGTWKLEVHMDGDSQQTVNGNVRLSWRNKKQGD